MFVRLITRNRTCRQYNRSVNRNAISEKNYAYHLPCDFPKLHETNSVRDNLCRSGITEQRTSLSYLTMLCELILSRVNGGPTLACSSLRLNETNIIWESQIGQNSDGLTESYPPSGPFSSAKHLELLAWALNMWGSTSFLPPLFSIYVLRTSPCAPMNDLSSKSTAPTSSSSALARGGRSVKPLFGELHCHKSLQ